MGMRGPKAGNPRLDRGESASPFEITKMKFMVKLERKDLEEAIYLLLKERGIIPASSTFYYTINNARHVIGEPFADVHLKEIPKLPSNGPFR